MCSGVSRMKNHIARTKKDISVCPFVNEHIKQIFLELSTGFEEKKSKAKNDERFQVDSDEGNTKLDETLKSFLKKGTQKTMNQVLKNRKPVTRAFLSPSIW